MNANVFTMTIVMVCTSLLFLGYILDHTDAGEEGTTNDLHASASQPILRDGHQESSLSQTDITYPHKNANVVEQLNTCGRQGYVFVKYVASPLELSWNQSIANVSKDWGGSGCAKVRADMQKYDGWYAASKSTQSVAISQDEGVMSYHVYRDPCSKENRMIKVPIEPIMGILRHPNAICMPRLKHNGDVYRKDWLILPNADYFKERKHAKVILYDLGASLYKSGAGGASQEWFVKEFAARGMPFTDIFGWEAVPHAPREVFKDIPPDMLPKLRYYNVPVEVDPNGLHNPIRMLKISAKKEDYVVLKVDIDTSWLELALVKQLMADEAALHLVDEFFFEHHTLGNPMVNFWGASAQGDITQSYAMFAELRRRGLRAHSWV